MEAGDYLYVFAFWNHLMLVARMRVERRIEREFTSGERAFSTYTTGVEGTEGTPINFERPVSSRAMSRLSWFSGNEERCAKLDAEGRLPSSTSVNGVLRLTPRTANDLDAILRGDPLS
jgi:hypothetical protein